MVEFVLIPKGTFLALLFTMQGAYGWPIRIELDDTSHYHRKVTIECGEANAGKVVRFMADHGFYAQLPEYDHAWDTSGI